MIYDCVVVVAGLGSLNLAFKLAKNIKIKTYVYLNGRSYGGRISINKKILYMKWVLLVLIKIINYFFN